MLVSLIGNGKRTKRKGKATMATVETINYSVSSEATDAVSREVARIISSAEQIIQYVFEKLDGYVPTSEGKQRLTSTDLSHKIAKKLDLPESLCSGVVSVWLDNHPILVSPRGKMGGIQTRSEVENRRKNGSGEKREPRQEIAIPGLDY
jgi:hypothetical protein